MSILLLAAEDDPSADAMVRTLTGRQAAVHRIDTAWFPRQLTLAAELTRGRWGGTLATPHRTIDLGEVSAIWYRSPRAYEFPAEMSPTERHHAGIEAKYGLGGVLSSLPVIWINHPARMADATYKPHQLALAASCGLTVADTVITNSARAVRDFAAGGPTVTKMLGMGSLVENGARRALYTQPLDTSDLADLRGIEHTAHQFQRWADKHHEARVIAIGHRINAFAIYAGSDAGHVDWRTDYDGNRYELTEPPADVATGIRDLMKRLDLVYGALDFVIGPDGQWTFLEINPGGQYGWLEHHTGADLTGQLADLLMTGETR
ncbi:ATP-grasp ribosomal peptide maturase [Saccharopolyspora sp. TS4A08]|uniref:ATP-grasp ribosomal peptide maturase n=1 Tax=Saccharopolyspora ipomoeae TaxID=3042027 RepID=A0ABT6PVZ5_9PSEU|nr:ATP-grasp ribosomal peptide maturase [Saccharopolyspora sp. TS4A08]MDI2032010.1 ATP-grasp ribosomal peptide maturase [Saccharopolyspora sp. TS4A08]